MLRFVRSVLITSVIVAAIGYYMRPQFPPSASNHGIKTTIWVYMKMIKTACALGGLVGISPINATRAMMDLQLIFARPLDTVQEYTTQMDGIDVTIFKPAGTSDGLRPGIIHYHGGGWILLSSDHYAPVLRAIVEETQSIIVSVNYRLAPEYTFPVPIEDCLKATKYFLRNPEKYGVDPNKIGIKGDSAGGNLAMAAVLSLVKEDNRNLPGLKFMNLDYPALQALDFDLPCYRRHEFGPGFLNKRMMIEYFLGYGFGHTEYFEDFYANNHLTEDLRSPYEECINWEHLPKNITDEYNPKSSVVKKGNSVVSKKVKDVILNPLFSPLLATEEELSMFPPSYIMNAEFDILRDDGFILAERLRQAGVEVEHNYLPSEEHGFLNLIEIDETARVEVKSFAKFMKRILT